MDPSTRPAVVRVWGRASPHLSHWFACACVRMCMRASGKGRLVVQGAPLQSQRGNQRAQPKLVRRRVQSVEHSFGSAPPKHQLSPPISVVMSALLIQQGEERGEGGLRGPGSDGARAHSLSPGYVWRVCFLFRAQR